jgi:D-amino-acid dehydrogenase
VHVAVIGGGLVGLACVHALLDEGHMVTLVEPGAEPGRPSDGNAGWIAHVDILPLASPKVWRNLPRWLFDPLGPLSIRPAHLPRLLPWLARFVAASSPARIAGSSRAIRALNAMALPAWERRLDGLRLADHLRRSGQLSVWSSERAFAAARATLDTQRRLGIAVEVLDRQGIAQIEPALGPRAAAGALYHDMLHVADPAHLTAALRDRAFARQCRHVDGRAQGVVPTPDGVRIQVEGNRMVAASACVIAAGIWSRPLAAAVGDPVPLDTERGYNVTLPPGTLGLTRPVAYEGEGFVTTPLDTGDRVGGAVEFGGLEAAPDMRRVDAILARLRPWLPDLPAQLPDGPRWMGFRPSLPDSLPVIGRSAANPRIVHAFGHGHHGLTQAAATAEIVAALIADRPPPTDPAPYSPARFR